MGNLKQDAIDAVKDYLIMLLNNGDFCSAKSVGRALEQLVSICDPEESCQEECPPTTMGRNLR